MNKTNQPKPETLPCGCRRDGRVICDEHYRTSVARFVIEETQRLVVLGLFVAVVMTWVAILT